MIEVYRKKKPTKLTEEMVQNALPKDIIVERKDKIIIIDNEDGSRTTKQTYKKVNLTKLTNETAKIVKINNAEQKLAELKTAIEKETQNLKNLKESK